MDISARRRAIPTVLGELLVVSLSPERSSFCSRKESPVCSLSGAKLGPQGLFYACRLSIHHVAPSDGPPISSCSSERVNTYPLLLENFVHRVLGSEWAFISDESTLWDFHGEESNDPFLTKSQEVYRVDVSDIETAKICEILERIALCQPDRWR